MIYKPYSLLPSDLEDGRNVIDISKDTTFSFLVTGTTPIDRMGIQIGDLDSTSPVGLVYDSASPVYYTNLDGSAKLISMTFTSESLRNAVGTSSDQKWRVWVRDINNEPTLSDWVFVKLRTTPSASISTPTTVSTKSNTWALNYTPSVPYENRVVGTTQTQIRSIRWKVFDAMNTKDALADTGEIFGCVQPSYTFDGLMSDHTYYAEVSVVDQDGVVTTATSDNVVVSYPQGNSGIMQLVYTNEIQDVAGDFVHGREVALSISNFSGKEGESSGGKDGYTTVNIGDPTGYVLKNHTGNLISWDGAPCDSDSLMIRVRFTPVPYMHGNNIMSVYVTDDRSKRVRYSIYSGGGSGTIFPTDDLYPSSSLYPAVGEYFIRGWYEELVDGSWVEGIGFLESVDINHLAVDDFAYFEHNVRSDEFNDLSQFGQDVKVELYGQDTSMIAYVVIDANNTSYSSDDDSQINPPISDDTVFAVYFNNMLYAVNLETMSSPERVSFYRFQSDESSQFQVAKIALGEAELPSYIIDFTVANGESYQYVMYPEDDSTVYAGTHGYRPTDGGESIDGFVACEMIVTSRWNEDYGAYVAERVFYFDLNNKPQPINNNAVVQKNQTFGRFFHIQHGATNVLSGQISGMIGYIDCSTMEFVSDFETEDAIRWLTTDTTTKLYKSARGYVLPVDITSPITFTPWQNRKVSDVSFEWTEIKLQHPTTVIGVVKE